MNRVLLNDRRRRWHVRTPQQAFRTRGQRRGPPQWFRLPLPARAGERVWRWLAHERHRRRLHRLLKACRILCMVTSEVVIDGPFGDGLRVGLIPMSIVARVLIEGDSPLGEARLHVLHTLQNKSMLDGHRQAR